MHEINEIYQTKTQTINKNMQRNEHNSSDSEIMNLTNEKLVNKNNKTNQ